MEKLKPKLFSVMKTYTKQQLIKDIVAGIIVAIIALPLSIALALASGVTPEKGIYTAIIAGFVISFLGGSRVQIAGPTAAFATIVAGIVAKNGMSGLIIATVLAGMDVSSIITDVSVLIETDGAAVTRIRLSYDMRNIALGANTQFENSKVVIDARYSYDLQSITLIDKK